MRVLRKVKTDRRRFLTMDDVMMGDVEADLPRVTSTLDLAVDDISREVERSLENLRTVVGRLEGMTPEIELMHQRDPSLLARVARLEERAGLLVDLSIRVLRHV